jgi:hypothetical protein
VEGIMDVLNKMLPGVKPSQSGPGEGWVAWSCFYSDGTGLYWVTRVKDTFPWRKVSSYWMKTFSHTIQTAASVYVTWDEACRINFWCGIQAKTAGIPPAPPTRGGKGR